MENFGGLVKQLREHRGLGGRQMARIALGEDATADDVEYYADQLSKLESARAGNTNPTLQRIWDVARGFGFQNIDEFFAELKRVPDLINHHGRKDLRPSAAKHDNPPSPQQGQDYGHSTFVSELEPSARDLIESSAVHITESLNKLSTAIGALCNKFDALIARVEAGDRQTPKADPQPAHSRARHSGRARKSG